MIDERLRIDIENRLARLRKLEKKYWGLRDAFIAVFRETREKRLEDEMRDLRRGIGNSLIGAFSTDSSNKLVRHCNSIIDAANGLVSSYVESPVDENPFSYSDVEAHMRAVASGDTNERKVWFSRYLGLFSGLELDAGWRMGAIDQGDGHGGNTKVFLTDDNGHFCTNIFEHIHLADDRDESLINVALLNHLVGQLRLKWHALYNRSWFVTDVKKFFDEYSFYGSDCDGQLLMCHFAKKYIDYTYLYEFDFSPRVLHEGSTAIVRYVTFSPYGGFGEDLIAISHQNLQKLDKRSRNIIKYDCQIRF